MNAIEIMQLIAFLWPMIKELLEGLDKAIKATNERDEVKAIINKHVAALLTDKIKEMVA